jgi:hypothetical protein
VRGSAANAAAQLWLASLRSSWRWTPAKATLILAANDLPARRSVVGRALVYRCAAGASDAGPGAAARARPSVTVAGKPLIYEVRADMLARIG